MLDYEPRAADQVPLLMSMQEDELALIKAIESGDTDLGNYCILKKMNKFYSCLRNLFINFYTVYLVMLHLKRKLPLPEFFRIINNKPMACNLFEVYCKQQDLKLLADFYYQDDRCVESANITILESYKQKVCII